MRQKRRLVMLHWSMFLAGQASLSIFDEIGQDKMVGQSWKCLLISQRIAPALIYLYSYF